MLITISLAKAQIKDFSFYDASNNFLIAREISITFNQKVNISDFIFPLAVEQEKMQFKKDEVKTDIKKSQPTWSYVVKKGETLWSISRKFGVSLNELLRVNGLTESSVIRYGDKILMPGVKPQASIAVQSSKKFIGKFVSALTQVGNFVIPVSGLNWGEKHSNNGTDIAAECGQEVYAANSGTVIESIDGWNGGYGNYIIIQHSEGIYSLYGHLSLRLVEKGDEVKKGELIGYVGNTGYTLGSTGCHLHFEVRGGTNPLLR